MMNKLMFTLCTLCLFIGTLGLQAQNIPGVESKLGETIPLDLEFIDEQGNKVKLNNLIDRPTVISLVYYKCRSICHPVMEEMGRVVDECELELGIDYRVITVSIDPEEDNALARKTKYEKMGKMKSHVAPEAWRFLTGDQENIQQLASALGYQFSDKEGNIIHPSAIVFVSPSGKIVRYKSGLAILAADLKMGVLNAKREQPLSIMENLAKLCFGQEPTGKANLKVVNRILLVFSLSLIMVFVSFLYFSGKNKKGNSNE